MNKPPSPQKRTAPKQPAKVKASAAPFHFAGRKFHLLFMASVIALSFLLYGNTIPNGFSLDDEFVLHNDTIVKQGFKGIPRLFKNRYAWDQKGSYGYRPISKASFAIESQFFGDSPQAGHVINILLYALLSLVIFYFLRKILYAWVSDYFLLIFLALFMTHPLHTEVTASLKNREVILVFLLGFFSSYSFLKGFEVKSMILKTGWFITGAIALNIALLAKPDALLYLGVTALILFYFATNDNGKGIKAGIISALFLSLIFTSLCYFLTPRHRGIAISSALTLLFSAFLFLSYKFKFNPKGNIFGVIAAIISLACYQISFMVRSMVINHVLPHSDYKRSMLFFENPLLHTHWYERIALGFYSLWFYIGKLLFPWNLSSYYGYKAIDCFPEWTNPSVMAGILLAGGMGYLIFKNLSVMRAPQTDKQTRLMEGQVRQTDGQTGKNLLLFCLLLFAGTIFGYINILRVGPGVVAERFMFEPSIGFILLICILLFYLFKTDVKSGKMNIGLKSIIYITAFISFIFTIRVIARNPDWKSHFSLYEHDAKVEPESAKLQSLLGAAYIEMAMKGGKTLSPEEQAKDFNLAETAYQAAVDIYPKYATSWNNLGMIQYSYHKNLRAAIADFAKALLIDTVYTEALFNDGAAYEALAGSASDEIKRLGGNPGSDDKIKELRKDIKSFDASSEYYYNRAIQTKPAYYNAYVNLSRLYLNEGKIDDAIALNQKAVDNGHISDVVLVNLGNAYLFKRDSVQAVEYFKRALTYYNKNYVLCQFLYKFYAKRGNTAMARRYKEMYDRAKEQEDAKKAETP